MFIRIHLLVLLWLTASTCSAALPLDDMIVVIDPGHGDRAYGGVPADPGAGAHTSHGEAWECVFTWDTAMRLKQTVEAQGGKVFLTLRSPNGDYAPHPWGPENFPTPGSPQFPYRELVDIPQPSSVHQALCSRVLTANRIYEEHHYSHRVVFLSLHYDSTNPDLQGISFYYPPWSEESRSVQSLKRTIRKHGRARRDIYTDRERGLAQPYSYAVLSLARNPDSFLMELGNIRSLDPQGKNPDLWRMRDPQTRQAYAELLTEALQAMPSRPRPPLIRPWPLLLSGLLLLLWMRIRQLRGTKARKLESAQHGRDPALPQTEP